MAGDPAHDTHQANRWVPDYDCSSAVISPGSWPGCCQKPTAQPIPQYAGVFLRCGFEDVTGVLTFHRRRLAARGRAAEIQHHTACTVHGMEIEQASTENGGVTGGQPGTRTGRSFCCVPTAIIPGTACCGIPAEMCRNGHARENQPHTITPSAANAETGHGGRRHYHRAAALTARGYYSGFLRRRLRS